MEEYWAYLNSFEAEKETNLYKAQRYSLNQRKALEAVLLDGRLEMTNNLAERAYTATRATSARSFSDTSPEK